MLGHSLELKGYAYRIENMPNPVNRGSNKPAQRKGSQVTRRVARKWIGLADAGEWGRAWLPAQAPGQSRTMGGCEQLFSAGVASPLSKTATVFSRTITPLTHTNRTASIPPRSRHTPRRLRSSLSLARRVPPLARVSAEAGECKGCYCGRPDCELKVLPGELRESVAKRSVAR